MTQRTASPYLRWQSLFFLFHYLFTLIVFSLPVQASRGDARPSLSDPYTQTTPLPASDAAEDSQPLRDRMTQFWGSAQQGGGGDAARGMAGSAVNSALTAEVESWLNMGGARARVTLDSGISGSHGRDAGLDYFYPLMDWQDSTLFTQLSFHRWNDRNQFNVGLGYRYDLSDHWMAGSNVFYDRDISRRHSRLGAGGELWGDRLRTSVNYYLPLSDWRLSHDDNLNDNPLLYDLYERPARGWDLSAEAALTRQIAVKGTWFQWYGDKVDVTGTRSQASRDPHGVTLGASWQPVPLLSLSAEHSTISGQNSDSRLGLSLNWQFGRSLAQMLDPAAAVVLSGLKEARHDFVSRNNNIVLAYQQREKDLRLYFEPTSLTTRAGSAPFIHAVKGGRGGFIVYHSSQPEVAQVVNGQGGMVIPLKRGEVTISAEEYQDASRTKLYSRAEYRLTIQPGDFTPAVTDVQISGDSAIGGTLSGSYTFVSNEGEDEGNSVQRWYRAEAPSEVLSDSAQYQQTAADVGKTLVYEVTPVNKDDLRGSPRSAQQTGPQFTLDKLVITAINGGGERQASGQIKFKAGESGMLLFEASVLDKDGNPVADQPVYWSHSNPALGRLDQARQMTNSKGESLVKFSDITVGGEDLIVASLLPDAVAVKTLNVTETTKSLPLAITFSAATNLKFIDPPQQVTVGDETHFTVQVTDEDHQAIEKAGLQITSAGKTTDYQTDKEGKASFILAAPLSAEPAQWTVKANLIGSAEQGDDAVIGLLADINSARVTDLKADPATAVVGSQVMLAATVKDQHGNLLRNGQVMVSFLNSKAGGPLGDTVATNAAGVATFGYTQKSTGEYHPAARIGGGTAIDTPVNFTADTVATLELARHFSGDLLADGTTPVSWTVTTKDEHGNRVPGAALIWKVTGPSGDLVPQKADVTNDKGEGTATVTLPTSEGMLRVTVSSGAASTEDSVTLQPVLTLVSLEASDNRPMVGGDVTLTAKVTSLAGNPLAGVLVDFANNHNDRMTEESAVRTDDRGLAKAVLKIKRGAELGAPGDYLVTATLADKPAEQRTATVHWQADVASAQVSELRADPATAAAGSKVTLIARVQDRHGNPVPNIDVLFLNDTGGGAPLARLATSAEGTASYPDYMQRVEGLYHPAARTESGTAQQTTVSFKADTVATLELKRNFSGDLHADGSTRVSWTVTAKDAHSNLAADAPLRWVVKGPSSNITFEKDDATDNKGEGTLTVTLPGANGALTVEVTSANGNSNDSVTLLPVMKLALLEASNANPAVGSNVMLTARVTNLAGDPLEGVTVDFTNDHSDLMTEQPGERTGADGLAQAMLMIKSGKELDAPGRYIVTATLKDKPSEQQTTTLNWQADVASAQVSQLIAEPEKAAIGSVVLLTATVKDRFGNLVKNGQALVSFLSSKSGSALGEAVATNATGVATYNYTQRVAAEYHPAARAGSGAALETTVTLWGRPSIDAVGTTPAGYVKAGETLTSSVIGFNAQGTGEDASLYQWFSREGDDWQAVNNAGQKTFTPDNHFAGQEVRVRVTPKGSEQAATGDPVYSDPVAVYGAPTIDSVHTSPQGGVMVGETITGNHQGFNAQGTGGDASTYQWFYRRPGAAADSWIKINAARLKTFTPDAGYAGYDIRLGVMPKGDAQQIEGEVKYSDPVTVYGVPAIYSASVTPSGSSLVGQKLTGSHSGFNANGTGADDSRYQWFSRPTGTSDWQVIDNAVQNEFTSNDDYIGLDVQVRVTPKGSDRDIQGVPKFSNAVSLYAKPTIETVRVSPAGSAEVNETLTASYDGFNAHGTGRDVSTYQWYFRPAGEGSSWSTIKNAQNKTLTIISSYSGFSVRVGITPKGSERADEGDEKFSDPVDIYGTPSITSASITPAGSSPVHEKLTGSHSGFNANGTGKDDSLYQWYSRPTGTTNWQVIDNAVQHEFTSNDDYIGLDVRVRVTPKGSNQQVTGQPKDSNAVSLYGTPSIRTVSISSKAAFKVNEALTATLSGFDAQGTGTDASLYQWYWRTPGDSNWSISQRPDAKQPIFTPDASYAGYEVQVGVTPKGSLQDVKGVTKFSDPVTVSGTPAIASVAVTPGGTVEPDVKLTAIINGFDAQGTGTNASLYQWYWRSPGGSWAKAQRADAQQPSFTPDATYAGYEVQAGVTPKGSGQDTKGTEIFSNVIAIARAVPVPSVSNLGYSGRTGACNRITATYTYNANGGPAEGKTIFKWKWGSSVVSNVQSVTLGYWGEVTLFVTPVNKDGTAGETESKTFNANGTSSCDW